MTFPSLPKGYQPIPAGQFIAGEHKGENVEAFGMKATPVTNAEWKQDVTRMLHEDRYVLLRHNWDTGETQFEKKGKSVEEVLGGPMPAAPNFDFDRGGVMEAGAMVLIKMVDNPSAWLDSIPRAVVSGDRVDVRRVVFSRAKQPAVVLSYFHAMAWCLLKTLESGGRLKYDLPTHLQYEYVASDRGIKQYGTENGTLVKDGRRLAHSPNVFGFQEILPGTAAVDDARYRQKLPFDVQTTGNIWRWLKFNPQYNNPKPPISYGAYGVRGGSFYIGPALANYTFSVGPSWSNSEVGFSPVVVPQEVLNIV